MYTFISGAIAVSCLVVGLFFSQFYKKIGERLFLLFSISFYILAFERVVLLFYQRPNETQPLVYLIRLLAFLIIIAAIADKNRKMSVK